MRFIFKQLVKQGFKYGFKKGFKEGYKRGEIFGSKGFVKLRPSVFSAYLDVYNEVRKFAIKANQVSFRKYNPPSYLPKNNILSRGCLLKIGERSVILHNSILSLCEDGWASVAPVILRSLLECLTNSLAIVMKDSEYMAFRFYCNEYLNQIIDDNINQSIKDIAMEQVNKQLIRLSEENQKRAKEFIQSFLKRDAPKIYWYKKEYKNTEDIFSQCNGKDMYESFKILSMSTHSTFMGSSLFKDEPDKLDINPRTDPKATKLALIFSSRVLFEIIKVRDQFEELNLSSEIQELNTKILNLKKSSNSLVF